MSMIMMTKSVDQNLSTLAVSPNKMTSIKKWTLYCNKTGYDNDDCDYANNYDKFAAFIPTEVMLEKMIP